MKRPSKQSPIEVDPFTVTTNKNDWQKFYSLDLFGQMDAAVNHASKPNMKAGIVFSLGLIWWCVNAVGCLALTSYTSGEELWSSKFHETLLKNIIAWDGIANHHGFAMFYGLLGIPDHRVKFKIGSIKDSILPNITGRRRNIFDILIHLVYDGSRIWLLKNVEPSPLCGWCVFGSAAALYIFDFGEYVGGYGMLHGPWSVFIVAKYCTTSPAPATAIMQFLLQLLYIGCGLGKMGPWFVGVFNQEWTCPPWALKVNIGPWLYNKNFPKDNTPSVIGSSLAYLAASVKWIAPLLLLCTSVVIEGTPGTPYVRSGLFLLIAMHFYINFHMPKVDLWMLNFTTAYILYNVYYISPHISEAGFDYELFAQLHPGFQAFCWFMLVYCIFGHFYPGRMNYLHCYRFWAGNWPQSYVLISEKGMEKIITTFPSYIKAGLPGDMFAKIDGPLWLFELFGFLQTTQLTHRVMPMLLQKGLKSGAALRGEDAPKSLTDLDKSKGLFCMGALFFNWGVGYMANDALRHPHLIEDFQQLCNFNPGEFVLLFSNSFPALAGVTGAKSYWSVIDANKGILDEGWVTVDEALSITRPSIWHNCDKKST